MYRNQDKLRLDGAFDPSKDFALTFTLTRDNCILGYFVFLKVAILCGELDLVCSLAPRLIHSFLLSSDWRGCLDVLKDCPGVEVRL